ncbi:MAG: glycosyl hydrolase family 18 protein [Gemmatimonadaceae bacterium]
MRRITSVVAALITAVACAAIGGTAQGRKSFWGFTGPWDARSHASLRAHAPELDVAVTGWIALDSLTGEPLLPSAYPDTARLRGGTTRRFALVTSWHGQGFHRASIRALGADPARLARAAGRIARHADSVGYAGLVLDFETLEAGDVATQLAVVRAIRDSARAHGVTTIAVAVPAEPSAAYPMRSLVDVADYVLVMLYDQHWPGSEPGPVSAPGWMTRNLSRIVGDVGASRVIAALPFYGYHWREGTAGVGVSYDAGMFTAERAGIVMRRDSASQAMRGTSTDGATSIWLTDAALLERLVRDVERLGVPRIAFWRLGQEDPAVWSRVITPR